MCRVRCPHGGRFQLLRRVRSTVGGRGVCHKCGAVGLPAPPATTAIATADARSGNDQRSLDATEDERPRDRLAHAGPTLAGLVRIARGSDPRASSQAPDRQLGGSSDGGWACNRGPGTRLYRPGVPAHICHRSRKRPLGRATSLVRTAGHRSRRWPGYMPSSPRLDLSRGPLRCVRFGSSQSTGARSAASRARRAL
jgi:hypothetical protein